MTRTKIHPLTRLKETLEAHGYMAAYGLLGDGNVRPWDWNKMRDLLSGELLTLWDFFLCGRLVSRTKLQRLFPRGTVEVLIERGICSETDGQITLGEHALIAYAGDAFFIDRSLVSKAFFGEETKALISLLPATCPAPCLSLFTGCALETLRADGQGDVWIVSKQIHSGIARANLELNGASDNYSILSEEQFATRNEARFRTILANALGFLEPEGLQMPAIVASGADGRRRLSVALETAQRTLTEDGALYFVSFFYGDYQSRKAVAELEEFVSGFGLAHQLYVIGKFRLEPGIPLFGQMVSMAANGAHRSFAPVADQIMSHLHAKGMNTVYLVKGKCTRPQKRRTSSVTFNFAEAYYGNWTF